MVYRLCSLDAHNGHQTPCALMSAPKLSAGVAYWLGIGSPVRSTEFDSPHPLHAGVAQVEEHRTRNAEVGVSNTPSGSSGKKLSLRATLSADKLGLYKCPSPVAQWESSRMVGDR